MKYDPDKPIFPIHVAAQMVAVTTKMLRIYEEEGLITPAREKGRRRYSQNDVDYIGCLRDLMKEGFSINSLNKVFNFIKHYEQEGFPETKAELLCAMKTFE